jgi:hypothetical protein
MEEIDPRNVSLLESDDESSCVGNVVSPGEQEETDEDVLTLPTVGRDSAPEIVKVGQPTFVICVSRLLNSYSGPKAKPHTRLYTTRRGSFGDYSAPKRRNRSTQRLSSGK